MNLKFWENWSSNSSASKSNGMGAEQSYWTNYFNSIPRIVSFDGEKTPYELGSPVEFWMNYDALRARAWESFITSDVIQNAIRKYVLWIVGAGLKVSAEPIDIILQQKGITLDKENFVQNVEAQFRLFCNSRESVYSRQMELHKLAVEALKNAILSGDVLVIQRYDGDRITTQIVDGKFIADPPSEGAEGRVIHDGVELNETGEHVAYYVLNSDGKYERIAARNSEGMLQAWLMYGLRHKINDTRGVSLLSAVLETASQIDRYKSATLGNAEENNNIPYTIVHDQHSDGENPIEKGFVQSMGRNKGIAPETETYAKCDAVASKISISTKKKVYNMPVGSRLDRNNFESDPNFKDFFGITSSIVYTTIGIPPEVAEDRFGGSYSSSRAALKSWEHKMKVDRENVIDKEFYGPIYNYWFAINTLTGSINAPGFTGLDTMGKEAYLNKRFVGVNIPHIDPVKEVNAARAKLGPSFANTPLATVDSTTEEMNSGDYNNIIKKAENEKELSNTHGFATVDNNNGESSNNVSRES